jgi:hypothetical protein
VVLLINQQYRLKHVLLAAARQFARENSIQLGQFLQPAFFKKANTVLMRAPVREHYVPDQYRCHEPKQLPAVVKELLAWLQSKECAALVSTIVKKTVKLKESCCCVYAHGDYTLLHDKNKELPGYDVILDLTPHWDRRACGHNSYVRDDGAEVVRIPSAGNTLSIVRRPKELQRFVKYVNHHAGKDGRAVLLARFA